MRLFNIFALRLSRFDAPSPQNDACVPRYGRRARAGMTCRERKYGYRRDTEHGFNEQKEIRASAVAPEGRTENRLFDDAA